MKYLTGSFLLNFFELVGAHVILLGLSIGFVFFLVLYVPSLFFTNVGILVVGGQLTWMLPPWVFVIPSVFVALFAFLLPSQELPKNALALEIAHRIERKLRAAARHKFFDESRVALLTTIGNRATKRILKTISFVSGCFFSFGFMLTCLLYSISLSRAIFLGIDQSASGIVYRNVSPGSASFWQVGVLVMDLILRGALIDIIEHFEFSFSPIKIDRAELFCSFLAFLYRTGGGFLIAYTVVTAWRLTRYTRALNEARTRR